MNIQVLQQHQRTFTQQELEAYFEPPPKPTLLIVGSVIFVLLGLPCASMTIQSSPIAAVLIAFFFGIPLWIGLIAQFQYSRKPRPTDEEYDAWVNSFYFALEKAGKQKLGLTPEAIMGEALHVRGIVLPGDPDSSFYSAYFYQYGRPIRTKRGKDGRLRSSINRFSMFYPAQHYIAVFTSDVNALDPIRFEGTQTYYYDDIVGVETKAHGSVDGQYTYGFQRFEVKASNGQSIGLTTSSGDQNVDKTVNSLRVLLRDKKFGTPNNGREHFTY